MRSVALSELLVEIIAVQLISNVFACTWSKSFCWWWEIWSFWSERKKNLVQKQFSMHTAILPTWTLWNEVKALELFGMKSIGVRMNRWQHEICIQLGVLNESLKQNTSPIWVCLKTELTAISHNLTPRNRTNHFSLVVIVYFPVCWFMFSSSERLQPVCECNNSFVAHRENAFQKPIEWFPHWTFWMF